MTKLYNILLVIALLLFPATISAENIIPFVFPSASTSDAAMPSINMVNFSGLSGATKTSTHDNDANGATMWSAKTSILDVKVVFDLQQNYNLKEMYIWNFNQLGNTDKGLKNVKLEYSSDNKTWTSVPAPTNPGYTMDASYPFQFAQGTGNSGMSATNLNDGKNTPINLSTINARYIRVTISQKTGTGNWGTIKTFGLSEVMFTTDDEVSDALNVSINPATVTATCGNMIFGGCHIPSFPHAQTMLPMLVDAGFNNIRSDMWLETILPENITYEEYINNVNDVQNPDNWDFSNMELAVLAKKAGMKVMMIISYCPKWLSYDGTTKGIPKDMAVYEDIVRKVYSRYYKYIDWIEIYNEPGYFMTIDKSPYSSVGAALAEIYVTCEKVVREITPEMPMGGTSVVTWSDGGVGGKTNKDFFAESRITKNNFNFYSHHVYGDYGIQTTKETVSRVKRELNKFGYGDVPIYFSEWSSSINNLADSITYIGTKSHTFVGTCLVNWMREGLEGAQHWNYLQAVSDVGGYESGISVDLHGIYAWNSKNKTGRLLPKAYVFKLLSKTLGLGEGKNDVLETLNSAESLLNIISFKNAKGEMSTVIVNENNVPVKIKLNNSITNVSKIEQYTVTFENKGEIGENVSFSSTGNGITSATITIAPMSVIGVKYHQ